MQFKEQDIHAAIFDMDGTMFDTERLRFKTLKQASSELFGEAIGDDILLGSLGLSARKAEALAKSRYGDAYPYADIRKRADELELAHVRAHGVPVKPGLYDVLERLKKTGLRMAVATSSRRAIAEEYLINANVLKYFDVTVCGDEVTQGKPHPEIFLKAAQAVNCLPEHCLMFEDSENGLLSASSAGGLPILLKDIKEPDAAIKAQAFHAYDSMRDFLADLVECTPVLGVPALTEPFPQTFNESVVGIHGFGAIGGGYLAQIFSHWDGYTRPAEIIGVTGNATLRGLVNAFGKFDVHYGDVAFDQTIDHVRLIDSADEAAVCDMYVRAEVIGLSLPESAIKQQAGLIAKGLAARCQAHDRPLTVLVALNKVGGAAFVRRYVEEALARKLPADAVEEIFARTYFAETVVNRIVTKVSREAMLKQVRINVGSFASQVAGHDGFGATSPSGELSVPALVDTLSQAWQLDRALSSLSMGLFHSGPDMALYAERGSKLLNRLRQIRTVENITEIQTIKNKLLNGTHAIIAWYSALLGYRTIGQGMGDDRVAALVEMLIEHEIKPAMLHENPRVAEHIDTFVGSFIKRCKVSFKDPCKRVGRDPMRKLQRKERILGSIDLAARHGVPTPMLEFGTALGLLYAIRFASPDDQECQRIKGLYDAHGAIEPVLCDRGDYQGKPYAGLDPVADAALIDRIAAHFDQLVDVDSGHWAQPLAAFEEREAA